MSDFDDNWQLKGTPDPATPDVQPNQIQQPVASPYQSAIQQPAQPVMQQPLAQPAAQPMQSAIQQTAQPVAQPAAQPIAQQPAQPVIQPQMQPQQVFAQPYQQPVYQQPAQPYAQPMGQPVYQAAPQMYGGYAYPGQPVAYQTPVDYAAINAQREASLAECQRIINHFSPKVDVFQKYETLNSNIDKFSKTSVAPLVWGILVALAGIISVVTTVLETKSIHNLVPYLIAGGVVVLIGGGLILIFVLKKRSHKKKLKAFIEEAGELSNQLELLYNGFGSCPLPSEYVDPRIVYKLQQVIMVGSANTLQDALNMLLSVQRAYPKIEAAKAAAAAVTAERYEGKPAFFNAVSYLNLR